MGKLKRNQKGKNRLIIIGSLFFIIGLSVVSYDILYDKHIDTIEEEALKVFYEKEEVEVTEEETIITQEEIKKVIKVDYIASIKIPKIKLERGLVNPKSYLNNINYNVTILDGSAMPDEENGNVILAAHSGNSRVAFFNNLDKLSLGDKVIIQYKNKTYTYSIVNIYDIEKTGKANIIRNSNIKTLTLITCRKKTNKQIVIICELMKEEDNE